MNIFPNTRHMALITMNRRAIAKLITAVITVVFQLVDAALYDITLDSFEPYSGTDSSFIDYGTLRVSKKSRNVFVIDGKFELFKNQDDDSRIIYQITLGDNRQPMFSGDVGFCESIDNDGVILNKLRQVSNIPPKGTCPYPKGMYHIDKYQLDETQIPPMVPPGQYMLIVQMVQNDQIKGGYKLKVTIK